MARLTREQVEAWAQALDAPEDPESRDHTKRDAIRDVRLVLGYLIEDVEIAEQKQTEADQRVEQITKEHEEQTARLLALETELAALRDELFQAQEQAKVQEARADQEKQRADAADGRAADHERSKLVLVEQIIEERRTRGDNVQGTVPAPGEPKVGDDLQSEG